MITFIRMDLMIERARHNLKLYQTLIKYTSDPVMYVSILIYIRGRTFVLSRQSCAQSPSFYVYAHIFHRSIALKLAMVVCILIQFRTLKCVV